MYPGQDVVEFGVGLIFFGVSMFVNLFVWDVVIEWLPLRRCEISTCRTWGIVSCTCRYE